MKQIIKDYTKIQGETDGKTYDFCFRILDNKDSYFKLPNKKNHPLVEFKKRKSHYNGYTYYVGTILRSILKQNHGLCLYSHTYDGYASIDHEQLEKSFLSSCKQIYNKKEIKQLMRNVA
jgi:hypothetical protein